MPNRKGRRNGTRRRSYEELGRQAVAKLQAEELDVQFAHIDLKAKRKAQSRNPKLTSVPDRSQGVDGSGCKWLNKKSRAHNSAVECHLHTVEVVGSNPAVPTNPKLFKTNQIAVSGTLRKR